jgi:predicted metal-dependent hydrolase
VVVPPRYRLDDLSDVLKRKARWILGKLAEIARAASGSTPRTLDSGSTVPYLDRQLTLAIERVDRPIGVVELRGDTLRVECADPARDVIPLLGTWYRREAAKRLGQRAEELARHMGVRYSRITVRAQKTLWASCSGRGTLSLNWRLMLAPQRIVDYVLIHELSHLQEPNHSQRFWRIVAEHCPDWWERRRWLAEHEREIHTMLSR